MSVAAGQEVRRPRRARGVWGCKELHFRIILSLRVSGARGLGGLRCTKGCPGSANPLHPTRSNSLLGPRGTAPAAGGVSGRSESDAGTQNGVQIGLKLGFKSAPRNQFRSKNRFAHFGNGSARKSGRRVDPILIETPVRTPLERSAADRLHWMGFGWVGLDWIGLD